jgi:hypothetical protein
MNSNVQIVIQVLKEIRSNPSNCMASDRGNDVRKLAFDSSVPTQPPLGNRVDRTSGFQLD